MFEGVDTFGKVKINFGGLTPFWCCLTGNIPLLQFASIKSHSGKFPQMSVPSRISIAASSAPLCSH